MRGAKAVLTAALMTVLFTVSQADESAMRLPKIRSWGKVAYYPDAAKRRGAEGKIIVAFDIDPSGVTRNIALVWSDGGWFDRMSLEQVAGLRFDLSQDPSARTRYARFRMGFVYCLPPSDIDESFGVDVATVIISGSRIAGAGPAPPPAGATNQCARTPGSSRR
jgi:TonB family protein